MLRGEGMRLDCSSFSRRGVFRLVAIAAFLLAGTIAAPLGARAVGDVVIDGDRISAVVIDTVGGLTLSRKLVRKAASDKEVEDAYHARMPVEGVVQGVVKGGYEVKVGRSRAFCPIFTLPKLSSLIFAATTRLLENHVATRTPPPISAPR